MSDIRVQDVLLQIYDLKVSQDSENARRLEALKGEYNALVDQQSRKKRRHTVDMTDVLPGSLWIQIIHEALPRYDYTVALLTLAMVSKRWMAEICLTPTLWSQIEFRPSMASFESSLEAFVCLSRDCAVDLVLYAPFREDSPVLARLVNRIRTRLRSVSWTHDSCLPDYLPSELAHFDVAHRSSLKSFFLFKEIESIESFSIFGKQAEPDKAPETSMAISDSNLPPNLRSVTGWTFSKENLQHIPLRLRQLHTVDCDLPLAHVIKALGAGARPRRLSIASYFLDRRPYLLLEEETPCLEPLGRWSKITSFSYRLHFTDYLLPFLAVIAPTVSDLEVRIPYSEAGQFLPLLGSFVRLRRLLVEVVGPTKSDEGTNATHYFATPNAGQDFGKLKELSLTFCNFSRASHPASDHPGPSAIFDFLERTYLGVESATFYFRYNCPLRPFKRYIAALVNLRELNIVDSEGTLWYQPCPALIPDTESAQPLITSTFRSLSLFWHRNFNEESMLAEFDTESLTIKQCRDGKTIKFPQGTFPSLIELHIHAPIPYIFTGGIFEPASFPNLTTFHLHGGDESMGPNTASQLCLQLLIRPKSCPRLSTLHFEDLLPEWDLLVMMLEARNFFPRGDISRIRTVTLPRVPEWIRRILQGLLRGHFIRRPTNEELSFKGIQNLIFNKIVSGCYTCLRYGWHLCDEPVLSIWLMDRWPYHDPNDPLNRVLDNMILDCSQFEWGADPRTSSWIARRAELLTDWMRGRKHWTAQYSRTWRCEKRQLDIKVRISEHDRMDNCEFVEDA